MHRVLVVGGGSIGERHVRCFIASGRAEVALCEPRPERLDQMRQTYDLAGTCTDFESEDLSGYDATVICVPANLHVPFAARAVDAGCHVLIEKPLALDLDGVAELSEAVADAGLTAGVAYVRRAMPVSQLAREAIADRRIGRILDATYTVGYDHRVARPDYRNTYEVRRDMGGGAFQDAFSHLANLMQWLLGPVREVRAVSEHLVVEGMDAEATVSVLLRFRDHPAIASVHCAMWHAARTDRLMLNSEAAQVVADGAAGKVGVLRRDAADWDWREVQIGPRDEKGQVDAPFLAEAENFLNAVEGREPVLCPLEEAAHTVQICTAAAESARTGRAVAI